MENQELERPVVSAVKRKAADSSFEDPFAPQESSTAVQAKTDGVQVVKKPESRTITLTTDDLALIVYAAQGHNPHPQPKEKRGFVEETLGAIGDGAHRIADGLRDVAGGLIDIITLGKANRR